jgi:hypothetical protein
MATWFILYDRNVTGRRTVAAGFVLAAVVVVVVQVVVVVVVVQVVELLRSRSGAANERRQSTARNQYWHPPHSIREWQNGPNHPFQQL